MSGRLPIALLISDVDGTLLDSAKHLSAANIAAARRLHSAGLQLALASSRPPRGMSMLIDALEPAEPLACCNGGFYVDRGLRVVESHCLDADAARRVLGILDAHRVSAWLFTAARWLIRDRQGPHVDHEIMTVGFDPELVAQFPEAAFAGIGKLVGVSDDADLLARCEQEVQKSLGSAVSASRSQSYYLDVTSPEADKGAVVRNLGRRLGVAKERIATIGDGRNDVLMFAASGFGIAMGNAVDAVKAAAGAVTADNKSDGFAQAVERYILGPAS